jgi:hypothetical protein
MSPIRRTMTILQLLKKYIYQWESSNESLREHRKVPDNLQVKLPLWTLELLVNTQTDDNTAASGDRPLPGMSKVKSIYWSEWLADWSNADCLLISDEWNSVDCSCLLYKKLRATREVLPVDRPFNDPGGFIAATTARERLLQHNRRFLTSVPIYGQICFSPAIPAIRTDFTL